MASGAIFFISASEVGFDLIFEIYMFRTSLELSEKIKMNWLLLGEHPDMMSTSEGGGRSWKSGPIKGGCVIESVPNAD